MKCSDLCERFSGKSILEIEQADDSCLELATAPSIAEFLGIKALKADLRARGFDSRCIKIYDDAGGCITVQDIHVEDLETNECVIEDHMDIVRRECHPSVEPITHDKAMKLLEFFGVLDDGGSGVLNPYPIETLYIENEEILITPPHTFIPEDSIDRMRKDLSKALRLGRVRDKIWKAGDNTIGFKIRDLRILLEDLNKDMRCSDLEDRILCLGGGGVIYIDPRDRIFIRDLEVKELSIRMNIELSRVFWSHPAGYAEAFLEHDLRLRSWWISASGIYHMISMASHPHIDVEVSRRGFIRARSEKKKIDLALDFGSSLNDTTPWLLSLGVLNPLKTSFGSKVSSYNIAVNPSHILVHDLWFDEFGRLNMLLVNHLDRGFGTIVRSSGYVTRAYISFRRNLWDEIISHHNMLRISMPPHSIAILRIEREAGGKITFRRLSKLSNQV
ncbi:MAG: hypothetical protein QXS89_03905 [Sulfolobales archaeon]